MQPITRNQLMQMTPEEISAYTKKLRNRALLNILVFAGIKVGIAYGIHRWAKSLADAS
jgi:hypothetical protein